MKSDKPQLDFTLESLTGYHSLFFHPYRSRQDLGMTFVAPITATFLLAAGTVITAGISALLLAAAPFVLVGGVCAYACSFKMGVDLAVGLSLATMVAPAMTVVLALAALFSMPVALSRIVSRTSATLLSASGCIGIDSQENDDAIISSSKSVKYSSTR